MNDLDQKYHIGRKGRLGLSFLLSGFLFFFIWIVSLFDNPPGFSLVVAIWMALEGFITWESIHYFQTKQSVKDGLGYWLKSIGVGVIAFCAVYYVFKWVDFYYGSEPPTYFHMIVSALIGFILSSIIVTLTEVIKWRAKWYESRLENERIQKDQVKAELSALQSHIDPHFLFNNLNTLYSLIYKEPELAADFLEKLAEIYRYILSNKDEQVVSAAKEWEMGMNYLDLLKSRYGKGILEEVTIKETDLESNFLPPLSVQQLIENAVKHNRVEVDKPLKISFNQTDTYLVVENQINPKFAPAKSHGSGLKNLKARFGHLTDQELLVDQTGERFCVSLPLLKMQQ